MKTLSVLEREIMERFHQLQPAKQRIRELIEQETVVEVEQAEFDYDSWFHAAPADTCQSRR